jgi:hypothetical protein
VTVLANVTHGLAKPTRAGRDTSAGKSMVSAIGEALVAAGLRDWERNAMLTAVGKDHPIIYAVEFKVKMPDGMVAVKPMWQASSGSAEMKAAWHILHLAKAVGEGNALRAYLVLGGDGWKKKAALLDHAYNPYIVNGDCVEVVELDRFLASVRRGLWL